MTDVEKYNSKPVQIEALQFLGNPENATPIINWVLDNGGSATWTEEQWFLDVHKKDKYSVPEHLSIRTPEGTMRADIGDYIIRGLIGEFYPCKPEVFAAKYELAV